MSRRRFWSMLLLAGLGAATAEGAELRLLPGVARLEGPRARQRFLVESAERGAFVADRTDKAVFAVGDGTTTLSATVDGRVARATLSVEDVDRDEPWSFQNHVLPVLTKAGCNSGACHGAAAGKNGLRLTLRGYGPEVDYDVLTRQALGRRVVKSAPAESLLLLKPTGAVEHGGGVRFDTDSLEYRVIADWIAAG